MRPYLVKFIVFIVWLQFCNCSAINPKNEASKPINHVLWDTLLAKHVSDKGEVHYKNFLKDSAQLNEYLSLLSKNAPNPTFWNKEEQLAYWLNAYNAFTVKLILTHYPINSIKDIGPQVQVPFVNTPWQDNFININGKLYHLDHLEHNIIRKNFDEPRIHFALVCAAKSCPKLRNEAYKGSMLDEQLADQARSFLSNTFKNRITPENIKLSKIFRWYRGDFTKNGTLIEFLKRYAPTNIHDDAQTSYMNYDWSLNDKQD